MVTEVAIISVCFAFSVKFEKLSPREQQTQQPANTYSSGGAPIWCPAKKALFWVPSRATYIEWQFVTFLGLNSIILDIFCCFLGYSTLRSNFVSYFGWALTVAVLFSFFFKFISPVSSCLSSTQFLYLVCCKKNEYFCLNSTYRGQLLHKHKIYLVRCKKNTANWATRHQSCKRHGSGKRPAPRDEKKWGSLGRCSSLLIVSTWGVVLRVHLLKKRRKRCQLKSG